MSVCNVENIQVVNPRSNYALYNLTLFLLLEF